ncbi:hypothetical protein FSP39_000492, partial [Pinctada imbricata]
VFIFAMTTGAVQSKLCQDQLALAYVSSKVIVPVAMETGDELLQHMDNGMKLQLAGFQWYFLNEDFDGGCKDLIDHLTETLTDIKEKEQNKDSNQQQKRPMLKREKTRQNLNQSMKMDTVKASHLYLEDGTAYWKKKFGNSDTIKWARFREQILTDFKEDFAQTFGEQDTEWLLAILHREMEVQNDEILLKDKFLDFCTIEDIVRPLWVRIQDQARESYAMREVFSVESTMRAKAIENLGKYKSATVVDALLDLVRDKDVNIQAVAIISLARTGASDINTITSFLKALNSKDRIVREAACLALGHVKATRAIDILVDLWRNDIISNVREAALVALQNIGGEKAQEAIRVTTVLEREIRTLKA